MPNTGDILVSSAFFLFEITDMLLNYVKLSQRPRVFRKLTGLSLQEFARILDLVSDSFTKAFPKIGRLRKVATHEDRLILILLYYRSYVTHEFIGYFVGLDDANVCRLFARIEPLIAKHIHIKKDRSLTEDVVGALLTDATEQPIQRPKNKKARKMYYSGKKKRHTQKTEITITTQSKIINISRTHPGSRHDITIRRQGNPLPSQAKKYGDLGYQGWQKESPHVYLPHKKPKHGKLTAQQKRENKEHSQIRILVEHKFAQLKKFRILGEVYRNFRTKHHLRFNIMAGIVNMQAGF